MAENDKPDKTPEQGQLSQQQLEAIAARVAELMGPVMDKRFSGFQGVMDKKVKELREDLESPDSDVASESRLGSTSRGDRAARRAAAEAHDREVSLARREIALEFGMKPEDIAGDTPDQMRIDVLTKLVRMKAETKPDEKPKGDDGKEEEKSVEKPLGYFTPLATKGNAVASSTPTTPDGMIAAGLQAIFKTVAK